MADACADCGIELSPALLVCPRCQALVHRRRLAELARDADAASAAGDHETAVSAWRSALMLLPQGSRQYDAVAEKIEAGLRAPQRSKPRPKTISGKVWGSITAAAIAIATKAKLLLLGLTKIGTLASIFVSFGIYWTAWGWRFAAALLASIYIHEIGHVAALRSRGIPASAPMFVPGVGAFVRMHQHAVTPSEDARIGLAGPLWGLSAAAIALGLFQWTHAPFWLAVAQVVGMLTVFNLTPVWQLDGSRGFHALSRVQRWLVIAAIAVAFAISRQKLLVLVGLVAGWRAFERRVETQHDWIALAQYVALVAVGAALMAIHVPAGR
jgi:Zn-dependent protease